jgi:hypothetical protein
MWLAAQMASFYVLDVGERVADEPRTLGLP